MYFMVNKAYYDFIKQLTNQEPIKFSELETKYGVGSNNQAFHDTIL